MPKYIGPNSRRFTKQDNRLTLPKLTDRIAFTIKGAGEVTTKNPLGYGTFLGDFNLIKQYVVNNLITKDLSKVIKVSKNSGLLGNGSESNPVRIDTEWLGDNYYPTAQMPITQIGNSTDFALPIAGSYFSVTYPFNSNRRLTHSAFVERNGELRILTHKTNGEQLRVTYSFWPNALNANSLTNTDIVYAPPELQKNEFIGGVFTASANAMLAEIWTDTGFKEWVFISLNGTFNHAFHTLLRLGRGLEAILPGNALQTSRSHNVCAVISKGKKYLVVGVNYDVTKIHGSAQVYEVDNDTGALTLTTGWRTTNSAGLTRFGDSYIGLYEQFSGHDLADKNTLMLITDDRLESIGHGGGGYGNQYFITLGPIDKNGRVGLLSQFYGVSSAQFMGSTSFRYAENLLIDFENRTVSARALSSKDQRWRVALTEDGRYPNVENRILGGNFFTSGHYYSTIDWAILLPYGIRLMSSSSADIAYKPSVTRFLNGSNNGLLDSLNPDKWGTSGYLSRSLELVPPTPIYSGYIGRVMFDKIVQITQAPSPYIDLSPRTPLNYGMLRGNKTDYVFNVLNGTALDGSSDEIPGFRLNAERYTLNEVNWHSINSFVNGSSYGYHNAVFGPEHPTDEYLDHQIAYFNSDLSKGDTRWGWTEAVKTKVTNYVLSMRNPTENTTWTNIYKWMFSVVPPFPGISPDMALVTILMSYIDPTIQEPDNINTVPSPFLKYVGLCPCKFTKDASGNLMLTDINLSLMVNNLVVSGASVPVISQDSGRRYTTTAWRVNVDSVDTIVMSGHDVRNMAGNNSNAATVQCVGKFDRTTGARIELRRTGGLSIPTYSPKVGFGIAFNNIGLSAFYGFYPVDEGLVYQSTNITVLGTARPPAGFAFTISAPIRIVTNGTIYELGIGVYDLSLLFPDPKLKKFYLTAKVVNDAVRLDITLTPPVQDSATSFYIGYITTTDTEIKEINASPVVRWEHYRPSQVPLGSAIPVSLGLPHEESTIDWKPVVGYDLIITREYPDMISTSSQEGLYPKNPVNLKTFVDGSGVVIDPKGVNLNIIVESDVAIIDPPCSF